MGEVYPKMGTLFALEHGSDADGRRKWFRATPHLLPDPQVAEWIGRRIMSHAAV